MSSLQLKPTKIPQNQAGALMWGAFKDVFKHPRRVAYRSEKLKPYDIAIISITLSLAVISAASLEIIGFVGAAILTLAASMLIVKQTRLVYTGYYGTISLEACYQELFHANQLATLNNDQDAKELLEAAKIAYLEGRKALSDMNRNGQDRYANGLITFRNAPERRNLPLVRKASVSLTMVYDACEEIISQNSNVTSLTAARINKQLDSYKARKIA